MLWIESARRGLQALCGTDRGALLLETARELSELLALLRIEHGRAVLRHLTRVEVVEATSGDALARANVQIESRRRLGDLAVAELHRDDTGDVRLVGRFVLGEAH